MAPALPEPEEQAAAGTKGVALVRRPGPLLHEGLVTHVQRGVVDPERAAHQHAAYRAALQAAGWTVREAEPADELPDAAFVEDAAVFLGRRAVLTNPGAPGRRDEVESVAAALDAIGVPTVRLPEGTLDGGDVMTVGKRMIVGRSSRTDGLGAVALGRLASEEGYDTMIVDVRGCLHLKTAATPLPRDAVIAHGRHADPGTFAQLDVVEAPEPAGANVLTLGDDHVAVSASAPATAQLLRERGLQVDVIDISEFEAVEAGLTCLSVLLPGVAA